MRLVQRPARRVRVQPDRSLECIFPLASSVSLATRLIENEANQTPLNGSTRTRPGPQQKCAGKSVYSSQVYRITSAEITSLQASRRKLLDPSETEEGGERGNRQFLTENVQFKAESNRPGISFPAARLLVI